MSSRTLISATCLRASSRIFGAALLLIILLQPLRLATARAQQPAAPPQGDGPVMVEGGRIFKPGEFRFQDIEPSKVAPMPKGWAAYNNTAYKIDFGQGVAVGPYVIQFRVASANDRKVFDNLRVLQAEWDKVDEKYSWQDRTILPPDEHAPNFATKTISANAEELGGFVLALLVEPQPAITAEADISVEIVAPSGRAVGNKELSYDIKLTNLGPQNAAEIVLNGSGFSSDQFVSATPAERGNGRCKQDGSNFGCKLDLLEKGASAVFRLVLNPREGPRWRYPEEGQNFVVLAWANTFGSIDPNFENNNARHDLRVYPDSNLAPKVKLIAPKEGALVVVPANIKLTAEASDPDGTLTKVEFYDGATLIGVGIPAGKNLYSFDWTNVPPGQRFLTVVATDDGGRSDHDMVGITVNGALSVRIAEPRPDAVLQLRSKYGEKHEIVYGTLNLDATAFIGENGRSIKEVVFVLSSGGLPYDGVDWRKEVAKPAGVDKATRETRYVVTFSNLKPISYVLTVTATDTEGIMTVSSPVRFRVQSAPLVRFSPEMNTATTYTTPANVTLRAEVFDGFERLFTSRSKGGKVDFYADGKMIGSAPIDGFMRLSSFQWLNAPAGIYTITAVATDRDGIASEPSEPLHITIRKEQ